MVDYNEESKLQSMSNNDLMSKIMTHKMKRAHTALNIAPINEAEELINFEWYNLNNKMENDSKSNKSNKSVTVFSNEGSTTNNKEPIHTSNNDGSQNLTIVEHATPKETPIITPKKNL